MFLKEFNQTPTTKVAKINKVLQEQFGISIKTNFPSKKKLEKVLENTNMALIKLRGTNKKFQLDPDYAKFLGIKDVIETMISEGMYAKSPAHEAMCAMVKETVHSLMDSGYTMDEAVGECMNRYRMDNRFAYDDEYVMPIVITAAKSYMEQYNMGETLAGGEMGATIGDKITGMPAHNSLSSKNVAENVLRILAKECGVELKDTTSYEAIEEKINAFSSVSGKSRDAVVEFLNSLDEAALLAGIQMFGRKIAEQNAYNQAAADAAKANKKEFEFPKGSGKMHPVKMDKGTAHKISGAKNESMFDDIINDILNEEVDVEQAEVVMAVRALADDVQDQIERIGRMMNEDIPAIADKMRGEMGAQAAQSFTDSVNGLLSSHLEATKNVKAGLDQAIGSVTGGEAVGGLGDTGELGATGLAEPDMPEEEPEMDVNEPAAAGPEEEPLGRAEV
jgi:hypothetical protein